MTASADLVRRLADGRGEFLLFAITPPRLSTSAERAQEIADATVGRLQSLEVDGLILYDIDDESARNPDERPFPFIPTRDPADYAVEHLRGWAKPTVVYRSVGKYDPAQLRDWLAAQQPERTLTVFVGASAHDAPAATALSQAQALRQEVAPALGLGGVAIPERHARRGDEHLRMLAKQEAGCRFFVSQVVFDVNAAKDLVSDYHYECVARGVRPAPIAFTFSVCGSMRTLRFLQWLGVEVPRWMQNELDHALDTLDASYQLALTTATELLGFCRALDVPVGLNVESVSIARVEIEASVKLAEQLSAELR